MTIKRSMTRLWDAVAGRPAHAADHADQTLPDLDGHYAPVFADIHDQPRAPTVEGERAHRSFVIAMLPRTGSTMFSLMLQRTLCVGVPDEWLNTGGPMQWHAKRLACRDFTSYWEALLRTSRTGNGYFGLKTDYRQLLPLIEHNALELYLPSARFAFLTREDIVGQAISLQRARSSGLWHRRRKGGHFGPKDRREPVYDRAKIDGHIAYLRQMENDWLAFFARRNISPLRLTYEELAADPLGAVRRSLDFCGAESRIDIATLTADTQKIGDELTEDWRRRYESERDAAMR